MKTNQIITIVLIVCAVPIWLFNGSMAIAIFTGHFPHKQMKSAAEDKVFSAIIYKADSVLKNNQKASGTRFKGDFENPFKPIGEAFAPPVKKGMLPPSPETQVKLVLKGVLLKKQPLAILEDSLGKTYICGVDETVKEQRVEKIESNRIFLRNSLGVYTLTVKE